MLTRRRGGKDLRHKIGGAKQVLKVVEDKQHLPAGQEVQQSLRGVGATGAGHLQRYAGWQPAPRQPQ